jgi:hypothetical protein
MLLTSEASAAWQARRAFSSEAHTLNGIMPTLLHRTRAA